MFKMKKLYIALGIFVAIVLLSALAKNIWTSHQEQEISEQQAEQTIEERTSVDDILTETQKELLNNYDSTANEIEAILEEGTWTKANSGTETATFTKGIIFKRSSNNDEQVTPSPFVIITAEKDSLSTTGGSESLMYQGSVLLDNVGSSFILQKTYQSSIGQEAWVLDCAGISDTPYLLSDANHAFDIVIDSNNFQEVLGSAENAEVVTTTLKAFCLKYYPTSTSATWTKEVNINYQTNILNTYFYIGSNTNTSSTSSKTKLVVRCPINKQLTANDIDIDKA